MFIKKLKLLLIIFLLYQTHVYSKSTSFKNYNSKNLSKYFSGIVAFGNKDNSSALNFFNSSKILLDKHDPYLKKYVYSLVLENKVSRAINEIKNNKDKSNANFFEANLLLIIDSLKKNDFEKATIYLKKTLSINQTDRFNLAILESLKQYIYVFKYKKVLDDKKYFGKLSLISETLQRCYLGDVSTDAYFYKLINDGEADYTRYIYFYLSYLIENNRFEDSKKIINDLDFINTTLLLSQGKSWIQNKNTEKLINVFSCKNPNDIIAEFLFLVSNLYSSQDKFEKSNFYLYLSNYLNPKFILNLSLVAENFYLNKEYDKATKVLKNFDKKYEFYYWFRSKKEAQIIIKKNGYDEGIDFINSKFSKIDNPNIKIIFDIANFYKNSKNYEKAIMYYSKIISLLSNNPEVKSDLLYRRGGSYERLGNYEKADEDLLNSLKINPDDAYVLNYLAYSWLERDYKIDEAMEMLKKAYDLRSNDPYITDSIGWAYYLIENYIEAEKYLKKAVELMPEDATVNDHYGDILWKLNRNMQARYFWNYVLSLDNADEEIKQKINIKILEGLKNS
mgnify:CR=1 FL=1